MTNSGLPPKKGDRKPARISTSSKISKKSCETSLKYTRGSNISSIDNLRDRKLEHLVFDNKVTQVQKEKGLEAFAGYDGIIGANIDMGWGMQLRWKRVKS